MITGGGLDSGGGCGGGVEVDMTENGKGKKYEGRESLLWP
jgi:hypothetical protein